MRLEWAPGEVQREVTVATLDMPDHDWRWYLRDRHPAKYWQFIPTKYYWKGNPEGYNYYRGRSEIRVG